MKFNIIRVVETGSTNDDLKQRAEAGAPALTVIAAERQTAGKGRLGRAFVSPDGLYFSVLLRRQVDVAALVTASAVAVCRAAEKLTDKKYGVKWVNDVYSEGRKVCGILCESVFSPDGSFAYSIVGTGINLSKKGLESVPVAGALFADNPPEGFRDRLLNECLNAFGKLLEEIQKKPHLDEYRRRMILTGRDADIVTAGKTLRARILGVDDDFRLHVRYPDGAEAFLSTGEVTRTILS